MTDQCKFGMGNYLFIPLAEDACIPVMGCVKSSHPQNHRPQRKRTEYSAVSSNREGRACQSWVKANTGDRNNRIGSLASPASCRWHVRKAICGKSGDLAASRNMPRKGLSKVVDPITLRERDCDWLQGVGGVHSTCDVKDSITFTKERDPAACTPHSGRGGLHSSLETQRGTRI